MTDTMRAIVLDAPGPPDALTIRELPIPTPVVGWVLIEVKAFGLNRSELHTRQGLASGVTFPRVLGIEAVGVVAQCPGGEFPVGQQVATMMGGMGRTFDGGYAEYTCVPASQAIAFARGLEWSTLRALSGMRSTACVCSTGWLSSGGPAGDFSRLESLPGGFRLPASHGGADALPPPVLQGFLDAVAAGDAVVPIDRVYGFDQIVDAHAAMEAGGAAGKLVVTT